MIGTNSILAKKPLCKILYVSFLIVKRLLISCLLVSSVYYFSEFCSFIKSADSSNLGVAIFAYVLSLFSLFLMELNRRKKWSSNILIFILSIWFLWINDSPLLSSTLLDANLYLYFFHVCLLGGIILAPIDLVLTFIRKRYLNNYVESIVVMLKIKGVFQDQAYNNLVVYLMIVLIYIWLFFTVKPPINSLALIQNNTQNNVQITNAGEVIKLPNEPLELVVQKVSFVSASS